MWRKKSKIFRQNWLFAQTTNVDVLFLVVDRPADRQKQNVQRYAVT